MEILKSGIITPSKFVFTFGYTTTDNFSLLMLPKSQMRHHRYIMKGI